MTAARELAEETGVQVSVGRLHQIGVWDRAGRDPRGAYVTFAYMVIVPNGTMPVAGDDARTARWWPVKNLPENLAFDHADIIGAAVTPNS
ncbi:NUDIX domain-containing protein [Streptomyces globosus]|uniref:NUDIX domain-containing protein n=1 Tax=Streptomyces globosus TaxID=68209 RepID=UPI0031D69FE2